MKRLICAVALLLILAFTVHASAFDFSSLDLFSSLSVNDLITARNILSEELMKHDYWEYTLSAGEHVVGDAIPPGVYTLSSPNLSHSSCQVCSADGEHLDFRSVEYDWKYHEMVERNGNIQIELKEGQVLKIRGCMTFYEY